MLIKLLSTIGGRLGKAFGIDGVQTISGIAMRMLTKYIKAEASIDMHYDQRDKEIFEYYSLGKQISSLEKVRESYGNYIPLIFGTAKVYGTVIWLHKFEINRSVTSYTKKRKSMFVSVAFGLCEGKITRISRVWHNDKLVDISKYEYKIYYGDENQGPDDLIKKQQSNPEYTPAFRGLAYIVFKNLDISDFNNKVPIFAFEVTRIPNLPYNSKIHPNVAHMIKSIVMIPGTGEFVLDTEVQRKDINDSSPYSSINCHNSANLANSIVSLNELLDTCSHVKWVAPVVCWFGTSLEASKCQIIPKVEYHDNNPPWRVAHLLERNQAEIVSKDAKGNLKYGGTIDDNSLLRYLALLKSKNLKIMFYPMVMMDIEGKPWRGHIKVSKISQLMADSEIAQFFRGGNNYTADEPSIGSYNAFILHYAKLVQGKVDAFIIGSELKNLTSTYYSAATSDENKFPAVVELVKLAKTVKRILGDNVLVSYAADWSEYHHINTVDGPYYHLDTLWASQDINFVGINAFFPLTNSQQDLLTTNEIKRGWYSGEGYDYHMSNNHPEPINQNFAWKNIKHWWENDHSNPGNKKTSWQPRMKPIWFTEFGFASLDKSTNQPNIFFDPFSLDGGLPKYSTGEVDCLIQARAIKATVDYWSQSQHAGMIQNMFLWAWDARPRPQHTKDFCWHDQSMWEKTHRVNNKLNGVNLAALIIELCHRGGLNAAVIDVSSIDEEVGGLAITQNYKIIDIITMLRNCYSFDINADAFNILNFRSRGQQPLMSVSASECLSRMKQDSIIYRTIPRNQILNSINFKFLNTHNDYMITSLYLNQEYNNHTFKSCSFNLPIITSLSAAQSICHNILKQANTENIIFSFVLPITYYFIKVNDVLVLEVNNTKVITRVTTIQYSKYAMVITAILHMSASDDLPDKA